MTAQPASLALSAVERFDTPLALFLARCAEAAYGYSPRSSPVQEAARWGLQAAPFDCGPISGFVGYDDQRCVLSFAGTHDLAGWLDDVNCTLVSQPQYPGRVHGGFACALESVWPSIESLLPCARPLYVTGHSLGGALASLAQWRLTTQGWIVQACITFGEPRVGDAAWASANQLPHWRVVHDCDPVPRVPFAPLYHHIGRMAWFDRFDRLNPDSTLWQRVANWIEEDIERWRGPWALRVVQLAQEHFMSAYIAALQAACGASKGI